MRTLTLAVLLAAAAAPASAGALECSGPGRTYIVKPKTFGVVNFEDFVPLKDALTANDQATVQTLLDRGSAVRVPDRAVACVRTPDDIAFHNARTRIYYSGGNVPVWVPDDALTPVQ